MKFRYKGEVYTLPSKWSDISIADLQALKNETDVFKQVEHFTGLSAEDLRLADDVKLNTLLALAFDFVNQVPKATELPKSINHEGKELVLPEDIAEGEYYKIYLFEKAHEVVSEDLPALLSTTLGIFMQGYFFDKVTPENADATALKLMDVDVETAYSVFNNYQKQLSKLNEDWSKSMPHTYRAEERKANPKELEKQGRWGQVYDMANGLQGMSYIWNCSWYEVFNASFREAHKAAYQERLMKQARK